MGVFIFLFIALIIIHPALNQIGDRKTRRKTETIVCFILLWLVQGLRHESIGIDSREAYRPFFERIAGDSLFDFSNSYLAFESGFVFLSKLIRTLITSDPQIYILICSFLSIVPIAYLFYKHSSNISFSFLVFATLILYHFGFSGIRQALAIGVTAISFEFLIRKKLLLFIVFVLMASTIHTSAVFFLLTYPIYWYVKLDKKRLLLYLVAFFIIILFLKPVAETIASYLFMGDIYANKLNQSFDGPSYNMVIVFMAMLLFSYAGKNSQNVMPYRVLLAMATLLQSMALITTTGSRMALYYIPYVCIVIPLVTEGFKSDTKKIVEFGIAAFLIFFFVYVNGNGYLDVVPYKFFWE